MNEMSDADKILFHQWINSEDANVAFIAWKTKQLKSLTPLDAPKPSKKRAKPKDNPVANDGSEFSGPLWDEHVKSCRLTGRDPYD
jgi:hypothetical protein